MVYRQGIFKDLAKLTMENGHGGGVSANVRDARAGIGDGQFVSKFRLNTAHGFLDSRFFQLRHVIEHDEERDQDQIEGHQQHRAAVLPDSSIGLARQFHVPLIETRQQSDDIILVVGRFRHCRAVHQIRIASVIHAHQIIHGRGIDTRNGNLRLDATGQLVTDEGFPILDDKGTLDNETTRTRDNAEDSDLTNFLGYEGSLSKILPTAASAASLVSLATKSSSKGTGAISRKESIKLVIAAIVTQILPYGNIVISGTQEVRVNFEKRILSITGVVRPEDISATNIVKHTQIAEARIAYGGAGQLSDVQQPRYGQQLFDVIFPF